MIATIYSSVARINISEVLENEFGNYLPDRDDIDNHIEFFRILRALEYSTSLEINSAAAHFILSGNRDLTEFEKLILYRALNIFIAKTNQKQN